MSITTSVCPKSRFHVETSFFKTPTSKRFPESAVMIQLLFMQRFRQAINLVPMTFQRTAKLYALGMIILCVDAHPASSADAQILNARTESASVLRLLRAIKEGYQKGEEFLQEFDVKGTVTPGDRSFRYVRSGRFARFDIAFDADSGRVTLKRLNDGERFFKLDGRGLTIAPLGKPDVTWRGLISDYSRYESPLYQEQELNVADRCDWLADLMSSTGPFSGTKLIESGAASLTITTSDTGTVLRLSAFDPENVGAEPLSALEMTLDPNRAFRLVQFDERYGQLASLSYAYHVQIDNEYAEVAPGVWFLSRGRRRYSQSRLPDATADAALSESTVVINDVQLGKPAVAPDFFSLRALNIRPGTHVQDDRVVPSAVFVYGQGDVEAEVLERAATHALKIDRSVERRPSMFYLLILNLIAFVGISLFFLYRWYRAKQ
jgi:hypothetical protein